ncbi:MAG TPA: hypothetical protein V6D33_15280, partial [Cyanophyceae cyanobacterium]
MKTLHSLTQPLTQLRRTSEHLRTWLLFKESASSAINTDAIEGVATDEPKHNDIVSHPRRQPRPPQRRRDRKAHTPMMWVIAVVSLT